MDFVEKNAEIVPDCINAVIDVALNERSNGSMQTGKSKRTFISAIKNELKQFIDQLKSTVCYED